MGNITYAPLHPDSPMGQLKTMFQKKYGVHVRPNPNASPAAAAPDVGDVDTGLSMDSSTTKRKKGLKGKRGLMIGFGGSTGGSTGGTTGTGLNI